MKKLTQAQIKQLELLADISHEIRTPLHGILSFARFGVQKSESAEREKLKDYFNEILICGNSLLELLDNLLAQATLETNGIKLESFDSGLLVKQTVKSFEAMASEKNLQLKLDASCKAECPVNGDRLKLAQVLRNLISNAIKFSHRGTQITVKTETTDPGLLQLSVSNQGVGIPENELESIFNKFTQGRGLAICKEIIQGHDGKIWAESSNGSTVFKFVLPAAGVAAIKKAA